jgi:GT2 family glycosyltransferase
MATRLSHPLRRLLGGLFPVNSSRERKEARAGIAQEEIVTGTPPGREIPGRFGRSGRERVTVVIPLYNKARTVQRALSSVLRQTVEDFEVVVVDDGSTDGSGDVVRKCLDQRVRLVVQQNAGPGVARNRGLADARTGFVSFLDADDEWCPTFLEENLRTLEAHGSEASIVCAASVDFEPKRRWRPFRHRRSPLREGRWRLSPDTPWQEAAAVLDYLQWWKTISRVDCLRKWGGFFDRGPGAYHGEDLWLSFKVVLNEPIVISFQRLHIYHPEASELAPHAPAWRNGARPIAPFLSHAEEIEAVCPAALRDHLRHMLAPFALETARYLGSHRRRELGRDVLDRFDCRSLVPRSRYVRAWIRTSRFPFPARD